MEDDVINQAVWAYVSAHYNELYKLCLKASYNNPDVADELMSDEVYRQLYVLVERWDKVRPFKNYCNRYFYRHLRKIVARKFHKRNVALDSIAEKIIYSGEQESRVEVLELLDRCTPLERTAVVMTKMHGYTFREVAEKLNVSLGYVAKLVNNALDKMRA